jgi:hypothetical protein
VAAALGLRVWQLPVPARLLAPAVAVMERVLATPPLTRAQLGLLANGVVGEVVHTRGAARARADGVDGGAHRDARGTVPPWLGVSLRLPRGGSALPACDDCGCWCRLAALGIAALRATTPDIWWCMAVANLVLIPAALLGIGLPWRALLRAAGLALVFGTAAAAVLYGLGWLGATALTATAPQLMAQASELYTWGAAAGRGRVAAAVHHRVRRGDLLARGGGVAGGGAAGARGGAVWRRRRCSRWRTCWSGRRCCGSRRSPAGWCGRGWWAARGATSVWRSSVTASAISRSCFRSRHIDSL